MVFVEDNKEGAGEVGDMESSEDSRQTADHREVAEFEPSKKRGRLLNKPAKTVTKGRGKRRAGSKMMRWFLYGSVAAVVVYFAGVLIVWKIVSGLFKAV